MNGPSIIIGAVIAASGALFGATTAFLFDERTIFLAPIIAPIIAFGLYTAGSMLGGWLAILLLRRGGK